MAFVIQVDAARCTGCKSCEIACALAHSSSRELVAAALGEPEIEPRVRVRKMGELAVPIQCRHCGDAPCTAVCPNDALSKDDSTRLVLLHPERCQGTGACFEACPFGVLVEGPDDHVLTKCDLCVAETSQGGSPACVSACPTGALTWVEVDEEVRHRVQWLVDFSIDKEACKACGLCKKACPAEAIEGKSGKKEKTPHEIDPAKCIRCGRCFNACPFDAVRMAWQDQPRDEAAVTDSARG